MRKLSIVLALVIILSAFLTGCGGGGGSGEKVIKIGVFEPLTGENGVGGQQEVDGIKYANKIKPTVNIGGEEYKIELLISDNKSDKNEAPEAATYLVDEGVVGVLGSYGSSVSIAAGAIFKEAGIPAIGCSCTNPQVTKGNDFYFRVCFIDPFQGTVMANYATQKGAKKAAVITQLGDDYSTGLGKFFEDAFVKLTGDKKAIVASQTFQQNQADFNAILQNVKAAKPDVIFAPSSITTAPLLIKQARAIGITCPIMGGDTWENGAIVDSAGTDAEGITLSTFFDQGLADASQVCKDFVEGYTAELAGMEGNIPAVAALGYDSYMVLLDAIERAGTTEGTAIRDALVAIDNFDGVTGGISFDINGDAQRNMAVIKTVKNGKFVFLESVELAI